MHILIKKIDEYKSKNHKNKVILEYIVYLMVDDTPVEAVTAFGAEEKDLAVLRYYNRFAWQTDIKIIEKN